MKVLGLDVGTKRIGVAVVDSAVKIAIPNCVVVVNGNEMTEIIKLARAHNTEWIVVGLPRNNEGVETAQSAYVRSFTAKLLRSMPMAKIRFQDESLTSVVAEERLKARNRKYAKGDIDAEAAAIILQDFIDHVAINAQTEYMSGEQIAPPRPSVAQLATPRPIEQKPQSVAAQHTQKPAKPIKPKKEMPMYKKILITLLLIIFALGVGGFIAYGWYNGSLEPVVGGVNCTETPNDSNCEPVKFVVSEGESVKTIAANLESAGLIKSAFTFQIYTNTHGSSDQLKVGVYRFLRTMSVAEIVDQLVEGVEDENVFSFTIYPGETVKKVKEDLIKIGYTKEEVNAAFAKQYDHPVLAGHPATNPYGAEPLEGYIYGDTYEFFKGESVEKIITTALDALYSVVQKDDLVKKYTAQGLSLYEGITLASIVQREGKTIDYPTIAQVFYSRLSQGMALGSDVTVQYALDLVDPGRKKYTDNALALEVDSPYNTRRYGQLPPGPICNPGSAALVGTAEPSETSYLYFLTGDDGRMYYSYTPEEHNQNIIDHCQNLCGVSL